MRVGYLATSALAKSDGRSQHGERGYLDAVPERRSQGFEIVRYREERGRFDDVRQLEEVPGLAGKWNGAEVSVQVWITPSAAGCPCYRGG